MKEKLKIVHIVEAFGGGVYNYLVDLLNGTINEFEITVIYARRPQTPENFEKEFDNRIKFIEAKHLTREIGIEDVKAFFEVKKILKEEDYKILYLYIIGEYKHREIAEILNLPLGTVTWKYKNSLKKLKKVLLEEEKKDAQ